MRKSIKVLQVLDFLSQYSGVNAVVTNYVYHMDYTRVACDFLVFDKPDEEIGSRLNALGDKIYISFKPAAGNIPAYWRFVRNFFAEHASEYDIIHVHIPNNAFLLLYYARKYGIPVRIVHSHNARGADGIVKKIRNFILNKWGLLYANRFFACSKKAGDYLFGADKAKKVQIINNAIELQKYRFDERTRADIREKLGVGQAFLLGNVGRFVEQKNQMFLLDILRQLRHRGSDCKLLLLGDGQLGRELHDRVEELGLQDAVIFCGVVSDVWKYLSAMDVFVLPSLFEGLPVVLVEAQASGLSCVVSANVTRETALSDKVQFIGLDEPDKWVFAIEALAHTRENRGRQTDMTELAAYDICTQAKLLEEIYCSYVDTDTHVNL